MTASKYDPAMCERVVELGKQGASQKMMAADLEISQKTWQTWKKDNAEFGDAVDLALVNSQAYWERLMLVNAENKNFNTRMVEIAVRGQFQEDYRDRMDKKVDIKADVNIDFKGAVDALINELKQDEQ